MAGEDFIRWALDPTRSVEEQYLAERLVGPALGVWLQQHNIQVPFDWETIRLERKRRKLNPAYRTTLNQQEVERAAECLGAVQYLSLGDHDDRPVRTLAGVGFAANASSVSVHGAGVRDWSPLAALTKLNFLSITDAEAEEFGSLGACSQVRQLIVYSQRPWPKLAGWEGMGQLEKLDWNGNPLALEDVPRLDRVRTVKVAHSFHTNLPLRDATRLPVMPALAALTINSINRLDGLERYPNLCNLTLTGPIRDLAPLAKLPRLTHLCLASDELEELTPLARLPELRYLRIVGERPLDWFVLADMPRLHEVEVKGCELNTHEVATLQEVLTPWDDDFRAAAPRPLKPARLIVRRKDEAQLAGVEEPTGDGPAGWHGNRGMQWSEQQWHSRRFAAALHRLLGDRNWGRVGKSFGWEYDFRADIHVTTFAGGMRLPAIVEAIRPLLAESRFARSVHICADSDPSWDYDPDEQLDEQAQAERDRQDEEDFAQQREERARFLERQHRLRLQQQEGGPIQPEEFAPDEEPPPPADEDAADEEAEPQFLEGQRFFVYAWITEAGLHIGANCREDAERLMTQRAEDDEQS